MPGMRYPVRAAFALLLLMAAASCARSADRSAGGLILAGPMVGHASDSSARIWLKVAEDAKLLASVEPAASGHVIRVEDLGYGSRAVVIEGLAPAAEYSVEVAATAGSQSQTERVHFRTCHPPSATGTVRIAFGSCAKVTQYKSVPIYRAMAAEKPDLAVFVGDNSYFIVGDGGEKQFSTSGPVGDWTSAEKMLARHLENRLCPDLQDLLRSTPCYAVWDDHDYGPNNADLEFALKQDALNVFKSVWANPSYGTARTPGVFSSFRAGPVEVFLMDDRYHKYVATDGRKDVPRQEACIWGPEQLEWLMAGLKASTAPVKLIANGTQVISETAKGEGHFQESPAERERLFAFLRENKIGGVVFLSGDRHYSESLRLEQEGGPWILEFTSSPMQQGKPIAPLDRVRHRTQLWGLDGNSYGLVTVDIPEPGRGTIRFEARDEGNHVPIIRGHRTVTTTELRMLNY